MLKGITRPLTPFPGWKSRHAAVEPTARARAGDLNVSCRVCAARATSLTSTIWNLRQRSHFHYLKDTCPSWTLTGVGATAAL